MVKCLLLIGLALGAANVGSAAAFTNGSFESPGGAGLTIIGPTYVTGWTHGTSAVDVYTFSGDYGINAAAGNYYITFGGNGSTGGTMAQTFDTTIGTLYTVNYMLT